MTSYPEKKSGVLSDHKGMSTMGAVLSKPIKMGDSFSGQPQKTLPNNEHAFEKKLLEAIEKKRMEDHLQSMQQQKQTLINQAGYGKTNPEQFFFPHPSHFVRNTLFLKQARSHKAVLIIKPGVLTSSYEPILLPHLAFLQHSPAFHLCLPEADELAQELEKKPGDLTFVFDFVKTNRDAILLLGRCSNTYVVVGDHFFPFTCKELYLARKTRLAVLGMVFLLQWLVLVGEDGHVYAYDTRSDIITDIGNSLKQLLQDGIRTAVKQSKVLWAIEEDLEVKARASFDYGANRPYDREIHQRVPQQHLVRLDPKTFSMLNTTCLLKFGGLEFCLSDVYELIQYWEQKPGNLDGIKNFVERFEGYILPLGNHSNTYLEIGDLKKQNLWWSKFTVKSWDELYLPARTRVVVIGVVRPFPTWIVLMGEDGRVYAYEHDAIHQIGNSLKDLLQHGIDYGSTMYWQKLPGYHSDKRISWITHDNSSEGCWEFISENTSNEPVKSSIPVIEKHEAASAYLDLWLPYETHQQGLSLAKKLMEELEKKSGDPALILNFAANHQMTFLPIGKHRRTYLKIDYHTHFSPFQMGIINFIFPSIRIIKLLGRMYPFFQWIVFLSEKGHVYACAEHDDFGDMIFQIANSLLELLRDGINYTGTVYWRKHPEDFNDEDKTIIGVQSKTEASACDSDIGSPGSRRSTSDESISKETEMSSIPKSPEDSGRISPAHAECTFSHEIEQLPTSESSISKSPEDSGRISSAHAECILNHEIEQLHISKSSIPISQEISEESTPTHSESSLSQKPELPCTLDPELLHKLENLGHELQHNFPAGDLMLVSNFVKCHEKEKLPLRGSSTMYLQLCDLSGTEYMGRAYILKSWEELYLPKPTKMEVLGTLEDTRGTLPCPPWIVLVGEDRHVYAYEDENIYMIADSLQALAQMGINISTSYTFPKNIPLEDEDILQQDPEIQDIRQRTRDLMVKNDDNFEDW